jgi:hypothetical protein
MFGLKIVIYGGAAQNLVEQVEHLRTCGVTPKPDDALYEKTIELLGDLEENAARLSELASTKPSRKEKKQHDKSLVSSEQDVDAIAQQCVLCLKDIMKSHESAMWHEEFVDLSSALL